MLALLDISGMNALFYAVDGEYANVVRVLCKADCNVNQQDNDNGWTPLIRLGENELTVQISLPL
ncbi:unnamed protein product [Protopolystoma xenopodis]|uniref:Uncharacterized protein n=1 Tax=Protopolystoma xenopodis TaxID=117903 RepID=A0A448WXL1_9PLAT|nr:unnamed protein product [Protopolystoma xenopodis]